MSYIQIHKGAGLIILGIALIILCAIVLAHTRTGHPVFANCTEARAAGYSNIPSTSAAYNPALDRNHNNIACER